MDISFGELVALYLMTLFVFLTIDLLWLGVIAKERYRKALKRFMVKEYRPFRVLAFYAIYVVGLLVMVLVPAVNDDSLGIAMFRGAAFET